MVGPVSPLLPPSLHLAVVAVQESLALQEQVNTTHLPCTQGAPLHSRLVVQPCEVVQTWLTQDEPVGQSPLTEQVADAVTSLGTEAPQLANNPTVNSSSAIRPALRIGRPSVKMPRRSCRAPKFPIVWRKTAIIAGISVAKNR